MSGNEIHELVARVKEYFAENGRAPTRGEFCRLVSGASYKLDRGGLKWADLLHAAGMPTYKERRGRGDGSGHLTNAIFERDIPSVLAERPALIEVPQVGPMAPTLIIPDTHFPWINQRVLDAVYKWAQKEKPARVVQCGDLFDLYSHSKFPKSLNVYKPQEEEQLARKGAEEMWKTIRGIVPNAECVQLKGNHDIRALRRTLESLPALEHVVAKHYDDLMTFDGVTLIKDSRQEYIVGDVEFIHGYRSKLGDHRDYALMNAVCGHIHVGGTSFRKIRGRVLYELNCGLAGDPESKALGYTPQRMTNWTPGHGWVDEYGPRFIPV